MRLSRFPLFPPFFIALLVGLIGARGTLAGAEQAPSPPSRIAAAAGCLASADFVREALRALGLDIGQPVAIRYHAGSIPGMMATLGLLHIAVYAKDQQHGWLFLVDSDSKRGFVVVRNAYRLTRSRDKWQADEGNGGLATYEAVSRFAGTLFKSRRYLLHLTPAKSGCSVE